MSLDPEATRPSSSGPGTPRPAYQHSRYEVLEELSRGGMGVVYRARHRQLGKEVALKVILERDPEPRLLARFEREAKTLASLEVEGVVDITDYGVEGGLPYLVMPIVRGRELRDVVDAQRPDLDLVWLRDAFARLAEALAACHAQGVVHRDLKPANVLVRDDTRRPVLIDFGLVKAPGASQQGLSATGDVLGTPSTMAPEQLDASQGAVGPPADVWGLGATLFRCLTGRAPFEGTTAVNIFTAVLTRDPPRVRALTPEVPRDLDALCAACLAKDPGQRPTMAQVAERLRAPPEPPGRPLLAAGILGLGLLGFGLGAVGLYLASRTPGPSTSPTPSPAQRPTAAAPADAARVRDAAELRRALRTTPAGGTIRLGPGEYGIGPIVLLRPLTLVGPRDAPALIWSTGREVIHAASPGVRLENLRIEMRAPLPHDPERSGIRITALGVEVVRCEVLANGVQRAVQVREGAAQLVDCTLRHATSGITVQQGLAVLRGCQVRGIRWASGVNVLGSRVALIRCVVANSEHAGLYAAGFPTLHLEDSRFEHNGKHGVEVISGTLTASRVVCRENQGDGLQATRGARLLIRDSELKQNKGSGVALRDANATLINCRSEGHALDGFYLRDCRRADLRACTSLRNGVGIHARGATSLAVIRGTVEGNGVGVRVRERSAVTLTRVPLAKNRRPEKVEPPGQLRRN